MNATSKVTFENEDGYRKATLTIIQKGNEVDASIVFSPEISNKESELPESLYARLAIMFSGYLMDLFGDNVELDMD